MMMDMNYGNMVRSGAVHFTGSANLNAAPSNQTGAVTSELGLELLQRIAGV